MAGGAGAERVIPLKVIPLNKAFAPEWAEAKVGATKGSNLVHARVVGCLLLGYRGARHGHQLPVDPALAQEGGDEVEVRASDERAVCIGVTGVNVTMVGISDDHGRFGSCEREAQRPAAEAAPQLRCHTQPAAALVSVQQGTPARLGVFP
eukprot:1195304-Prorocentrum_minimum.AAC.3